MKLNPGNLERDRRDRVPCLQAALALALVISLPVCAAQNSISLVNGTLAGQGIDPSQAAIRVEPGAPITGSFTVRVHNAMSPAAIAPLAATPTWGEPATSYWEINPWVATGDSTHTVSVNLTAPSTLGVYYVAVAMAGTYNSAQIMSGTHPAADADWINGNKVALLPRCDFEAATKQSWIAFHWYQPGIGTVAGDLAMTAIRVEVVNGGDNNEIHLVSGTLAGQTLNPTEPEIAVTAGSPIQGSLAVQVHNTMSGNAIAPLAATPTWGDPQASYWQVNSWVGTGDTTHTVPVDLTAPATPGVFYIAVAMAGTYNSAQIMSGTHPAWEADWANGNKVALLPACDFELAALLGWIPFAWHQPGGSPAVGVMAMTTVRVVVSANHTETFAKTGQPTLNGQVRDTIALNAGETLTGSFPFRVANGPNSNAIAIGVVGYVNANNQWVSGTEPWVIYSGIPPQAGENGTANIPSHAVPTSAGAYSLRYRAYWVTSNAEAISRFKNNEEYSNRYGDVASVSVQSATPLHGKIAYIRYDTYTLWVYDTVTSTSTLVPVDPLVIPFIGSAAWRPDGDWIVFSGGVPLNTQIHTVRPNGTGLRRISDGAGDLVDLAVSADGARVAYQQVYGNVFVSNFDGSTIMDTGYGIDMVCWSPDGTKMVGCNWAIAGGGYNSDLFIRDMANGTLSQITTRPEGTAYVKPAWSPDGSRIVAVFAHDGQQDIVSMNPDGTGIANLTLDWTSDEHQPSWTPDGQYLLFTSNHDGASGVWVMRPDGTERQKLISGGGAALVTPTFLPHGPTETFARTGQPTLNGQVRDTITLNAGETLTGSFPFRVANGPNPNAIAIGVVGYVSANNQWLSGTEPWVVYSGIPPQAGENETANIPSHAVPTSAGAYTLRYRAYWVTSNAEAINRFKNNEEYSNRYGDVATITVRPAPEVVATHRAGCYRSPGTLTITCQVTYPVGRNLLSLLWRPHLPALSWAIQSASGPGNPEVRQGDIVWTGTVPPSPIEFTYTIAVPAGESGEKPILDELEYMLDGMANPGTSFAISNPLVVGNCPAYHTADYQDARWQIDGSEVNRVLSYWREGSYHCDLTGWDGFAPGNGATGCVRHSADYRDPAWVIDGTEVNRVLSYWRAGAYHPDPAGADGYAPGAGVGGLTAAIGEKGAKEFVHLGPPAYEPGLTIAITNTFVYDGQMLSLLWRPQLPPAWTIKSVSGDGNPELQWGEMVWSGSMPASPITMVYVVQVPAGETGAKAIRAQVEYQTALSANAQLAEVAASPMILRPVSHSPSFDAITRLEGGGVELRLHLPAGADYVVEATTDFKTWTLVEQGCSSSGDVVIREANVGKSKARYFRASWVQ